MPNMKFKFINKFHSNEHTGHSSEQKQNKPHDASISFSLSMTKLKLAIQINKILLGNPSLSQLIYARTENYKMKKKKHTHKSLKSRFNHEQQKLHHIEVKNGKSGSKSNE